MAKKKRKKAKKPVKRFKKSIKKIRAKKILSKPAKRFKKKIKKTRKPSARRKKNRVKAKKIRASKKTYKPGREKPVIRKSMQEREQPVLKISPQTTHEEAKAAHSREEKPNASAPPKTPAIKAAIIGIAVAAGLAMFSLFYVNVKKCGEAFAEIASVSYEGEKAREAREGRPGKATDLRARQIGIIKEAVAKPGSKKTEREYFAGHFREGIPSSVQLRKNIIALGVVYAEKTAKIGWRRNKSCPASKTRKWLSPLPQMDVKKTAAFETAAGAFIVDAKIRGEAIAFYKEPGVSVDVAADAAPYYVYYLNHAFIFENYPAINGIAPQYPEVSEGDAADFLAMEEMFKIFESKAAALYDLSRLIDTSTGKISASAAEKAKKAAAELAVVITAADAQTEQKFMTTALEASLAARQWAKMENSKYKKPWFETTYDDDLNDAKVKRYLSRLKSAKVSAEERRLVAAAALMLYKTSRCMSTFTWSKKYAAYAENYRLAHSIIMHYVNSYDALLCKKLADELDRYYAGRYYGTVIR